MSGKHIGYIRVSSADQNTERQLDGIALDKTFTDHASGKDNTRPQLALLLDYLRDGDTLVVHSMDRLARNVDDLRRTVKTLTVKAIAKARGVYRGGKPRLTPLQTAELVERVGLGHGKTQIARDLGISRKTLYNYLDRLQTSGLPVVC